MLKYTPIFLALVFLVGCGPSYKEVQLREKIASKPVKVIRVDTDGNHMFYRVAIENEYGRRYIEIEDGYPILIVGDECTIKVNDMGSFEIEKTPEK